MGRTESVVLIPHGGSLSREQAGLSRERTFGGIPQLCAEQRREFSDAGHGAKCSAQADP